MYFSNKPGLLWGLDSAVCRELSKVSSHTIIGPIQIIRTKSSYINFFFKFYSYIVKI